MSTSIKVSDLIRQYSGQGNILEWIQKLEMVASMQKIENLASFLPMFLTDGAFSVYQGFNEEDRLDYGRVKKLLIQAFSVDQFTAFERLKERKLLPGESVDVFLAEIRQLIYLTCRNTTLDECKEFVKTAFVTGLDDRTKSQIRAACSLSSMTLESIVERTRNLLRQGNSELRETAFVSKETERTRNLLRQENNELRETAFVSKSELRCFICNSSTHIKRNCPHNKTVTQPERVRRCYLCNSPNHVLPQCPNKLSNISKNE